MSSTPGIGLARELVDAVRWWEEGLLAALDAAGHRRLGRTQVLLLCEVDPQVGTRASELAKSLGVTRQSIHQDVRKLCGMGLLDQQPDPGSRAAKRVVLTADGHALRRDAVEAATRLERELALRLGDEAWGGLRSALAADWGSPVASDSPAASGAPRR